MTNTWGFTIFLFDKCSWLLTDSNVLACWLIIGMRWVLVEVLEIHGKSEKRRYVYNLDNVCSSSEKQEM